MCLKLVVEGRKFNIANTISLVSSKYQYTNIEYTSLKTMCDTHLSHTANVMRERDIYIFVLLLLQCIYVVSWQWFNLASERTILFNIPKLKMQPHTKKSFNFTSEIT